jgi:hypothetical protein
MNGNVHVRFCSRAGMATSRLRQRPQLIRCLKYDPAPVYRGIPVGRQKGKRVKILIGGRRVR